MVKKANKSSYNAFYKKDEARHLSSIPIGSLQEEIALSKIILRRYLTEYCNDSKYLRTLTELLNTIRALEKDHKEISSASNTDSIMSMALAMREAIKELDNSVMGEANEQAI